MGKSTILHTCLALNKGNRLVHSNRHGGVNLSWFLPKEEKMQSLTLVLPTVYVAWFRHTVMNVIIVNSLNTYTVRSFECVSDVYYDSVLHIEHLGSFLFESEGPAIF